MNQLDNQLEISELNGNEELQIRIKTEPLGRGFLFMGSWLLFWGLAEIASLYVIWSVWATWLAGGGEIVRQAISSYRFWALGFILFFTFWTINGVDVIIQFLWEMGGVEEIGVTKRELSICRRWWHFKSSQTYEQSKIKNWQLLSNKKMRAAETVTKYNWHSSIGIIQFEYDGKAIQFGNGINQKKAKQLLKRVQAMLEQGEK